MIDHMREVSPTVESNARGDFLYAERVDGTLRRNSRLLSISSNIANPVGAFVCASHERPVCPCERGERGLASFPMSLAHLVE